MLIRQWALSLVVHAAALAGLVFLHVDTKTETALVEVISSINEPERADDFIDVLPRMDESVDLNTPVSLLPRGAAGAAGGAGALGVPGAAGGSALEGLGAGVLASTTTAASLARAREVSLNRPMGRLGAKINLGDNLEGIKGVSVDAGGSGPGSGGGDAGSVDRITQEILRQLEKNKVLVAWVMDASGSLGSRREEIIKRFDRIYHELEVLKANADDLLLTTIISFGEDVTLVTPKPTADKEAIAAAIRAIEPDDSGRENVFRAVKEACLKLRRYQTQSGRKLMIIVLTDEKGDDPSLADDTIKLVKRNKTPVYVLGPMAPFGRRVINVPYTEPESGEVFFLPVERGPETVQSERLSLPYWGRGEQFDLFPSGFGPYDLSRLARESGGIYFLFDDGNSGRSRFNGHDLVEYAPNYETTENYRQALARHPLRLAVIEAADDSRALEEAIVARGGGHEPALSFGAGDFNQAVSAEQQKAALTLRFVEEALAKLRAVEKDRPRETSKRWQATFDLMMGRLLATKVRCNEYNWHTARMKVNPKVPTGKTEDGKPNNTWRLVPSDEIEFGKKDEPDKGGAKTNVKKTDPKATLKAREEGAQAIEYLRRVLTDHPGTPWALLAQRELETPLGFRWEETFVEPPQPPERDPVRMAKETRRAEAAKKVPKGL